MAELAGRRILVTGAAGGLGSALVATLLAAGAEVGGLVREAGDVAALRGQHAAGAALHPIVADLARPEAAAAAVAAAIADRGPFYGLVNNAAFYPMAAATDLDAAEMEAVLAVNAVAAAAMARACVPGMKALGEGRIVNIASNTFDTGMAGLSAYVASKGALIGLARVWSRELGPFGITANAVSPGAFRTDAEKIHADPDAYDASVIAIQSIKRRGEPGEFADLVAFLLGSRAGFITGQTIRIDGGVVTQ